VIGWGKLIEYNNEYIRCQPFLGNKEFKAQHAPSHCYYNESKCKPSAFGEKVCM